MYTPDEIKQYVQTCREVLVDDCIDFPHAVHTTLHTAADVIESLLAEFEQVKRERDAAVEDICKAAFCGCHVCKHYYRPDPNVRKYACKIYGSFDEHDFIADDGSIFCGAMEWRGVQEVE